MLSSSSLLKNKEVLVDKWPGKIWEQWAKFFMVASRSWTWHFLHSTSVIVWVGKSSWWFINTYGSSYLHFGFGSMPPTHHSVADIFKWSHSVIKNSSICNTHKPSFSWPSSLNIAISSHTLVSEISNSYFAIRWLPVDNKSISRKFN